MSNELDFNQLKPKVQRAFVPADANLTDVKEVVALYEQLNVREIASSDELEQWLMDRSELDAALDQAGSILYIRMTCQTDDQARAAAYTHFIEHVSPAVQPLEDQLNQKYIDELKNYPLDEEIYAIFTKETKVDLDLFVQENVPIRTEVELLSQEYQTVCGAMTVNFKGKEQTMPQMGKYLLDPDRDLREGAWRAMAKRRLEDKDKLDEIFDQMLVKRNKIAENAKCRNFCEYKFRSLHRFDYTPADCKQYHDSIEQYVLPVIKGIYKRRTEQMGLDELRPWDLSVDPLGRSPLKPFTKVDELISGCQAMFGKLDEDLGQQFSDMAHKKLLDLESRKGKAPGGYQSALAEAREPFIFMNAVGVDSDVRTLLHEGGHAFHALACSHHKLYDYRHGPMEFCEVASMSMELLAGKYISEFYKSEEEKRSQLEHLEDIVLVLSWVAVIDAFQHWIYENPSQTKEDRKEAWLKINDRFSAGVVNWDGLEEEKSYLWHRQLHIFEVPFYYIEYGIAQIGALQLWRNAQSDEKQAVSDYKRGLALGGSRPLPELYEKAGIRFDFSAETIKPLMDAVQNASEKI